MLSKKLLVGNEGRQISRLLGNDLGALTTPANGAADLTASGSSNVKGSWSGLFFTGADLWGLHFLLASSTTGIREYLVDLATANDGTGIFLNNYQWSQEGVSSLWTQTQMVIPVYIPGGKTIYARCQSGTSGSQVRSRIWPIYRRWIRRDMQPFVIETYGANTADSGGTSVDPGTTIATKGSWTTIGTTTRRLTMFAVSVGSQGNTRATNDYYFDVGYGTTPTPVWNDLYVLNSSSAPPISNTYGPFPCDIPAGVDIKIRMQSDALNSSPGRLLDFTVYGFSPSR